MAKYDPKKVNVNINGFIATGFAEDSMIKASYNEDRINPHVGAQGDVDYSITADQTGEITINLKYNSPANHMLMQLAKKHKEFPVHCLDANFQGDVLASSDICMIKNIPDFERAKELGEMEWTIHAAKLEINLDI